ncbi:4Fe-4S single cluster domain-containing protein [Streptomyces sp. NPDC060194]|uniref:4Fe-4S single cluster domain-containing protein n=1 Tax=Streptomyces sp. NPDC060194 TaxID=3347069 RepID=UPI00365614B7
MAAFSISDGGILSSALRIGAVTACTSAEGPGRRFAVWTQGCSLRCPGCFNPHLWGARGGQRRVAADLASEALREARERRIEGVTLLGGEPFEQADACAAFAAEVRAAGLSVMVFTGYDLEFLEGAGRPSGAAELLARTDLLVDGRYCADLPDRRRPWVGSTNQRFHFLTRRYAYLEAALTTLPDRVEVRVSPSGDVVVNGWAGEDQLDELLSGIPPSPGTGRSR